MSITKYLVALSILVLMPSIISFAQNVKSKNETATVKKIESFFTKLEKIGYSGSVLVAVDGKPAISKGYGYADTERKIKNSPETIFDVGSITKQFTAAAMLKLEMQGKLSTDDRIGTFFQNIPADKSAITIHDLLRHSSGLPGGVGGDYEKINEQEFVEKVLSSPLRFPVGTRFSYSNVGYSLLALIIEKASGSSYEEYLYQELWKPAEMEMTGYSRPEFGSELIAVGYGKDGRWGRPTEKAWDGDVPFLHLKGNGGILSTTGDLFKWDKVLMTDRILSGEAKRKYYFPVLRADETGRSHYGYGWDIFKTGRDTTRVWHNGSNRVFYSDLYRFIDEEVTIILLTNSWQASFNNTGLAVSRIIFEPKFVPDIPIVDNASNRAFTEEIIRLAIEKGSTAAIDRFRKKSRRIDLLENVVNTKGYDLIEGKKLNEAIEVFKLNVFAFPRSANAYDSLGEGHLEAGNKELAIINYKISLSLDPENENARDVLKSLENR